MNTEPQQTRHRHRGGPGPAALPASPPARPDTVYPPSSGRGGHNHSVARSLALLLVLALAVGAAIWILSGVVFTVLHLLELVVVAAGAGWVGYRIGHYRGARRPRPRD